MMPVLIYAPMTLLVTQQLSMDNTDCIPTPVDSWRVAPQEPAANHLALRCCNPVNYCYLLHLLDKSWDSLGIVEHYLDMLGVNHSPILMMVQPQLLNHGAGLLDKWRGLDRAYIHNYPIFISYIDVGMENPKICTCTVIRNMKLTSIATA